MAIPRVYADFQNLDDLNRLTLNCAGTLRDLEHQGIELREGLVLTLCTDDENDEGQPDELRAEGVVHYDAQRQSWVAVIDCADLRHASDEDSQDAPQSESSGGGALSRSPEPDPPRTEARP